MKGGFSVLRAVLLSATLETTLMCRLRGSPCPRDNNFLIGGTSNGKDAICSIYHTSFRVGPGVAGAGCCSSIFVNVLTVVKWKGTVLIYRYL